MKLLILLLSVAIGFGIYFRMSQGSEESKGIGSPDARQETVDPANVKVKIGNKVLPLNRINRPHNVRPNMAGGLLRAGDHRPSVDEKKQ